MSERARRRGAVIIKCHVCGREGPRRSMVHRQERWVCRRIPACMDRILGEPEPEPIIVTASGRPYTITLPATLTKGAVVTVKWNDPLPAGFVYRTGGSPTTENGQQT